jgi:hypothetical protein
MCKECCSTCNILKNLRGEMYPIFLEDISPCEGINRNPPQMGSSPLKDNRREEAEDYDNRCHCTESQLTVVTSSPFPAKLKSTVGFMP